MRERKPGDQAPPNRPPLVTDRKTATTHFKEPVHLATAGKVYRVFDPARGDTPPHLWGESLSYADAVKLKGTVVGTGKSRRATIEEMVGVPPAIPSPRAAGDIYLDEVRQKALRAAQTATQAAQVRADNVAAGKKAAELASQIDPKALLVPDDGLPDVQEVHIDDFDTSDEDIP